MLTGSMSHSLFSNQAIDQSTITESVVNQTPYVILTETAPVHTHDQIPVKHLYHPDVTNSTIPTSNLTTQRSRSTSRRKSVSARRLSHGFLHRSISIQQIRDLVQAPARDSLDQSTTRYVSSTGNQQTGNT